MKPQKRRQRRYEITRSKHLEDPASFEQKLWKDSSRDATMILFALLTGARCSEVLAIETTDILHKEMAVNIKGLKGSRDRIFPLTPELFARIVMRAKEVGTGRLFPISRRRFNQIWHFYRPEKKRLHDLRHTFAIELYKRRKDIKLVQHALGHRSLKNTLVYSEYVFGLDEFRKGMYGDKEEG